MTGLSSTSLWVLILVVAGLTVLIKAVGPVLLGGRTLPPRVTAVITLLPAALLAALVATSVLGDGQEYAADASLVGVAVAGVLLWYRRPVLLAVLVAVAVTAGLRALG